MYTCNCSVDIVKQKNEVLERLQKTLEETSQRVPGVGHFAWPKGYYMNVGHILACTICCDGYRG